MERVKENRKQVKSIQATVLGRNHDTGLWDVRVRRNCRVEQLDPRTVVGVELSPGRRVEVYRRVNNPYLQFLGLSAVQTR